MEGTQQIILTGEERTFQSRMDVSFVLYCRGIQELRLEFKQTNAIPRTVLYPRGWGGGGVGVTGSFIIQISRPCCFQRVSLSVEGKHFWPACQGLR